ncbi:MAG: hypothetical protein ACN4E2_06545, partial [Nitrospinota bacterium]
MWKIVLAITLVTVAIPISSMAHEIKLHSYLKGKTIYGEAHFPDDTPLRNKVVKIYSTNENKLIKTLATDSDGKFITLLDEIDSDLRVELITSDGHKVVSNITKPDKTILKNHLEGSDATLTQEAIESLTSRVIQLEQANSKKSIATIIGAIGWIIGLFGLFFFFYKP